LRGVSRTPELISVEALKRCRSIGRAAIYIKSGLDELANGILDGVELADLGIGIEQQITERLVLATELRAQGRKQFLVEFEQVVGWSGFARRRLG